MKGYQEFTEYAPPASSKDERDRWFTDHQYIPEDLIRVGREVAAYRLSDLVDGDKLSAQELEGAMTLAFLLGFELAVRAERDEKPDLTPPAAANGNGG